MVRRLQCSPAAHRHLGTFPEGTVRLSPGWGNTPEEIEAGVWVVREDQGEGYAGYGPAQVWVAELADDPNDAAAKQITRVTHDDFWYGDPQWSPDGTYLVVHANRTDDRESVRYSINKNYDLWRIDLDDHKLHQLTTGTGPEVSPRIGPNGRRLVCLSRKLGGRSGAGSPNSI